MRLCAAMNTPSFPEDWQEIAWERLPVDIKLRAVGRLRAALQPAFFEDVRELAGRQGLGEWLPPGWHFGQGMGIRNLLRSNANVPTGARTYRPITDDELPALPEMYPSGGGSTWDDFYVQCVEAAAGLRRVTDAPSSAFLPPESSWGRAVTWLRSFLPRPR